MTVGSLFAGIGGFDLGFERSGFEVRWQVEQDGKAQSVLSARFPTARLYNDVRTVGVENLEPVDVICGGFPCQDVSVAGKREGLGGERTGLFWEAVRIIDELKPKYAVLENVPGLLSSRGGRDFHTVLSALADLGFRRAYRILDSRYFRVAQRRRRVFIVLRARRLGDGAEAVLFEPTRGDGDSPAGDEARAEVAATLRGRSHGPGVNMPGRGGEDDENLVTPFTATGGGFGDGDMPSLKANQTSGWGGAAAVAYTLRANERNTSQGPSNYVQTVMGVHANQRGEVRTSALSGSLNGSRSGKQYEGVMVPERERALTSSMWKGHDTDTLIPTLSASLGHHGHSSPRGDGNDPLVAFALRADPGGTGQGHNTTYPGYVRRLTPLECERLQGFPDYREIAIISVCSSALSQSVNPAGSPSNTRRLASDWPVAWRVVIDSERVRVLRRNRGKSLWSVNGADWCGSFPLSTLRANFAQLVVQMRQSAEQGIQRGAAASPTNGDCSLVRLNGMFACNVSGSEISALASDAARFTDTASACMKAITSSDGESQSSTDSSLRTLSCCVVAAISSCIPSGIRPESSFDLTLEYPSAWTCLCGEGHRGSSVCTCSDSPRYQQLGNAVTVPVAAWIARRILYADKR